MGQLFDCWGNNLNFDIHQLDTGYVDCGKEATVH